MKQRFAKLLLGEDMSGSDNGVSTVITVSNAITNLYGTHFLSDVLMICTLRRAITYACSLNSEKKMMWKREMNCLLSFCDYIVEFIPTSQSLQNGKAIDVISSRPRSDIYINLPALKKLDALLLVDQNTLFLSSRLLDPY
ncbi:putative PRONE domain, Rop guanine nucleotide exchange factor [Helianthus anomalus]